MPECVDSKKIPDLLVLLLIHNRNPIPRVSIEGHPGTDRKCVTHFWRILGLPHNAGGVSVKPQAFSSGTGNRLVEAFNLILRSAHRIASITPADIVEGPSRHFPLSLCRYSGRKCGQKCCKC